jgi:hypothetical protein
VCDVKNKQDIQKTSAGQFLALLAFVGFIVLSVFLMKDHFGVKPHALFGAAPTEQIK